MKKTARTTTHIFEYPSTDPTLEDVRMLPGPMTTQAVTSPGPTFWKNRENFDVDSLLGMMIQK